MIPQARTDYNRTVEAIDNSDMSDDDKTSAKQDAYDRYWYIVETEERRNRESESSSSSYSSSTYTSGTGFSGCGSSSDSDDFEELWYIVTAPFRWIGRAVSGIYNGISDAYLDLQLYHEENRAPEVKKEFKNEQEKIANAKKIIDHYNSEKRPYRKFAAYTLCAGSTLASTYAAITSENDNDLKCALVSLVCALWLTAYCSRIKTHKKNKCLKKVGKIFPEIKDKDTEEKNGTLRLMQYVVICAMLFEMVSEFDTMTSRLKYYNPESHAKHCQAIGKKEAPKHINSLLWISLYGLGGRIMINILQKEKLKNRKNAMLRSKRKDLFKDYIKE